MCGCPFISSYSSQYFPCKNLARSSLKMFGCLSWPSKYPLLRPLGRTIRRLMPLLLVRMLTLLACTSALLAQKWLHASCPKEHHQMLNTSCGCANSLQRVPSCRKFSTWQQMIVRHGFLKLAGQSLTSSPRQPICIPVISPSLSKRCMNVSCG